MRHGEERPAARTTGVVVKAVGDELLIYDLERHRAHSLNGAAAAAVWRACDGTREVAAIAATVATKTGRRLPVEAVRYALGELGRERLLMAPVEATDLTRRDLMRRLGTAAALPFVMSVVAPTAAHAQSCLPRGEGVCSADGQCCPPAVCGECPVGICCPSSGPATGVCTADIECCGSGFGSVVCQGTPAVAPRGPAVRTMATAALIRSWPIFACRRPARLARGERRSESAGRVRRLR
jgi:hypothetical protein